MRPRRGLPVLLAACCLAGAPAHAGAIDLSFNDEAARGSYAFEIAGGKLAVDAGWLHHTDDGDVAHLGLLLVGDDAFGSESLTAGLGGKGLFVDTDREEGFAFGIGGFLRYRRTPEARLGFGIELYASPEVLTSSELEDYLEYSAHVSYAVVEDAHFYAGYRVVEVGFESFPDEKLDRKIHVGLRLDF